MNDVESALFRNIVLPVSYAVAGRRPLHLLAELKQNQTLSSPDVANLQLQKLKQLVKHAYHNVPFYRQRFKQVGARPEDINSFADYVQLPLLTKGDLIKHVEEIVATNLNRQKLIYASTGGSTGVPVNYYHDARYEFEVAPAGMWRAWSWVGFQPGERHFHIWGGPREIKDAQTLRWKLKHLVLRRVFIDAFNLTEDHLGWAAQYARLYKPRFIYGYASSVTAFAKYLVDHRQSLSGVRAAMTTAERLLPEQRQIISRAFNCQVFDQYGCREVLCIASECRHGKLHINTDLNVVEFVTPPNQPQSDLRWVVLTPLELFGFPLLRYVNEDCGVPDVPCNCGLPFPTMALQSGRITDNFTLPSGRIVHGEYFTHLVYGTQGIKQFQFHQVMPNRIFFRIVWDSANPNAETLAQIRKLVAEAEVYLGEGCRIEMQEVPHIPLTASGKYRFTLSDVTPRMATPSN